MLCIQRALTYSSLLARAGYVLFEKGAQVCDCYPHVRSDSLCLCVIVQHLKHERTPVDEIAQAALYDLLRYTMIVPTEQVSQPATKQAVLRPLCLGPASRFR